jgi:hypothetical protein
MSCERRRSQTVWPELAVTWVSSTAFGAIVTAFHFVRTDLDPFRRGVSRYQWGEHGLVMSLAFIGLAVAFGCVGRILRRVRFVESRHVAALLNASAAGSVIVAFVPLPDTPRFLENAAHQLGGTIMFTASIAAMCMTPRRMVGPFASGVARIAALAGLAFVLTAAFGVPLTGLLQRVTLYGTCMWLVARSWRMATATIPTADSATSLART